MSVVKRMHDPVHQIMHTNNSSFSFNFSVATRSSCSFWCCWSRTADNSAVRRSAVPYYWEQKSIHHTRSLSACFLYQGDLSIHLTNMQKSARKQRDQLPGGALGASRQYCLCNSRSARSNDAFSRTKPSTLFLFCCQWVALYFALAADNAFAKIKPIDPLRLTKQAAWRKQNWPVPKRLIIFRRNEKQKVRVVTLMHT